MKKINTNQYPKKSDFEKILFLEGYVKQLKVVIEVKDKALSNKNKLFQEFKNQLRLKLPNNSKLLKYLEQSKVFKTRAKQAEILRIKAEDALFKSVMEVAELRLEIRALKESN